MVKTEYVMLNGVKYADVSGYARDLPPKRREKIERLRVEKDKLLSLTAGMLIRNRIGNTPLSENEHGKPYADGGQFFSVSHSGECVVIAVDDREIGIDVERLPDRDYLQIAERFYHPNELAYVRRAEDSARAFTYVWTRKEAYLKQIGIGIATDLKAFDTVSGELSERVASVDLEGYVISVCVEDSERLQDVYISELELKEVFY